MEAVRSRGQRMFVEILRLKRIKCNWWSDNDSYWIGLNYLKREQCSNAVSPISRVSRKKKQVSVASCRNRKKFENGISVNSVSGVDATFGWANFPNLLWNLFFEEGHLPRWSNDRHTFARFLLNENQCEISIVSFVTLFCRKSKFCHKIETHRSNDPSARVDFQRVKYDRIIEEKGTNVRANRRIIAQTFDSTSSRCDRFYVVPICYFSVSYLFHPSLHPSITSACI